MSGCSREERSILPHCGTQWPFFPTLNRRSVERITSEGDHCYVPMFANHLILIFSDVSKRLTNAHIFAQTIIPPGYAVIVMNYASNLRHGPKPSLEAMQGDTARAALYRLDLGIPHAQTYIVGISTGCMAASYMVQEFGRSYGGLILHAPYTSRSALRQCHKCALKDDILRWMSTLFTSGPAYHWDHGSVVQKIKNVPILVMLDRHDIHIPYTMQLQIWRLLEPRGAKQVRCVEVADTPYKSGYTLDNIVNLTRIFQPGAPLHTPQPNRAHQYGV